MTNRDNTELKNRLNLTGLGFKGAFIATLGFYAAQLVVTVIVLSTIIGGIVLFYKLLAS